MYYYTLLRIICHKRCKNPGYCALYDTLCQILLFNKQEIAIEKLINRKMEKRNQKIIGLLIALTGLFCFIVALLQVEDIFRTGDHLSVLFSVSIFIVGTLIIEKS